MRSHPLPGLLLSMPHDRCTGLIPIMRGVLRFLVTVVAVLVAALVPLPAAARPIEVPTFQIGPNTFTAGLRVATGTDGTMVFLWSDDAGDIHTQWYSQSGTSLAPAVRMNGGDGRALVGDTRGGYLIAFTRLSVADNLFHLLARRLDPMGHAAGAEIRVDMPGLPGVRPLSFDVLGLPSGSLLVWEQAAQLRGQLYDPDGVPSGAAFAIAPMTNGYGPYAAALSDGGFAVTWSDGPVNGFPRFVRTFHADGSARSAATLVPDNLVPQANVFDIGAIAGGDAGGFAVSGSAAYADGQRVVAVARFTGDAASLGTTVLDTVAPLTRVNTVIASDDAGNWHVAWAGERWESSQFVGFLPSRARPLAADGTPLEPAFELSNLPAGSVSTARLQSGSFLNAWSSLVGPIEINDWRGHANVLSLCTADVHTCGDALLDPRCEECDDGAANSDTGPDACRTTCVLPRCGDGAIDSAETCDDGGTESCDGCDASCQLEIGGGCGDGLLVPGCADRCDDGNQIVGDGCTSSCTLERVPGNGPPATDCYAEWVVNNPTNQPLFDKQGAFNLKQRCVDDDPQCDVDGGVPGSCTFRVRVCANNTDLPGCTPATRLASWDLTRPSAKQALASPSAAPVRAAFAAVAGVIVGPSTLDLCSDFVDVVVPMRDRGPAYKPGKLTLKSVAPAYDGSNDTDQLKLACVPPG